MIPELMAFRVMKISCISGSIYGTHYGYHNFHMRPQFLAGVVGGISGGIIGFWALPACIILSPVIIPYAVYENYKK